MLVVGSAQGTGELGGCSKRKQSRSGAAVPGRRGAVCWGSGRGHPLTYAQLDSVGVVGPAQQQADENHRDPVEHPPAPPPHTARARGRHLPAAHTCPAPPPPPPAGLARGRAWGSRITRRDRPGGGGRLRCGHCGRRGASSPSRGCERAPRTPAAQPGRGGGSEGEDEGDKEAGSSAPPPPGPRPVPASPPPTAWRAAPSGWCGGLWARTPAVSRTLGHSCSLTAGHRRCARGSDSVPTLALQLLRLAVDSGIAKRSDTRFGSPSPAASHSQGADPDQRGKLCRGARGRWGKSSPGTPASCNPTPHLPGPGRT